MSALKSGDLAFISHVHCRRTAYVIGQIVEFNRMANRGTITCLCGVPFEETFCYCSDHNGLGMYPAAWLTKIEPLSDLEKESEQLADPIHRVMPASV